MTTAWLAGCAEQVGRRPAPSAAFAYPGALATTPDGKHLLVVNTNFDLFYDGGAVVVVDTSTHEFVSEAAIEVPSFGGTMALRTASTGALVGYLTDRSRGNLNWFYVESGESGDVDLRCRAEPQTEPGIERCDANFAVREAKVGSQTVSLGSNPFGLGFREDANPSDALLFTGALGDGTLGVFELDGSGRPFLVDAIQLNDAGLYGIATSPFSKITYVATQFAQRLYAVATHPVNQAVLGQPGPAAPLSTPQSEKPNSPVANVRTVELPNADSASTFAQSLVFDPSGDRAYVTFRSPPAVGVVDMAPSASGEPRHTLLKWISVGDRPSEIVVVPGPPGKSTQLYVACFGSNDVYVIDTLSLAVVDVIQVGEGPFAIAVAEQAHIGLKRAYVSLFSEDAVAVVELNPHSPFYHQVVAKIR